MDDEGGQEEPYSYTGVESHGEGTTDDRTKAVDHKNTVTGHVQTDTDKLENVITLKRIVRINHILRWEMEAPGQGDIGAAGEMFS